MNVEWQPIETAPRDGTIFLAFEPGGRHHHRGAWPHSPRTAPGVALCSWDDYRCLQDGIDTIGWSVARNEDTQGGYVTTLNPTHWMPLPPETPK